MTIIIIINIMSFYLLLKYMNTKNDEKQKTKRNLCLA